MVPGYVGKRDRQLPPDAEMLHLTIAITLGVFNLKDTLNSKIQCLSGLKWLFFSNWEGARQNRRETKPIRIFF